MGLDRAASGALISEKWAAFRLRPEFLKLAELGNPGFRLPHNDGCGQGFGDRLVLNLTGEP